LSNNDRPDKWIIEDEQLRLIAFAIVQLPVEQREALALRLHGDMKFKQIAKMQGTSVGTAISRYRYGIDKLRLVLNGELTDETGR
jgi:RNA polymerase sigma-70 factor (ECF subfamily)